MTTANEEKKITFKTEEDRIKAIEELPTEPKQGQSYEDYEEEIVQKTEEFMTAEIDPATPDTPLAEPPDKTPADPPPEPPPEPPPADPLDEVKSTYEMRIRQMQEDSERRFQELQEKTQRQIEEKNAEWEKKFKDLKPEQPKESPLKDINAKIMKAREKFTNVIGQLREAEKDPLDENWSKLTDEKDELNKELWELMDERSNIQSKMQEQGIDGIRQTLKEEQETAEKNRKEREKQNAAIAAKKAAEDKVDQEVEKFRGGFEELKGDSNYSDMRKEFINYSNEIAVQYFGKLPEQITPEEREIAFAQYRAGLPALKQKVDTLGIKPPKDLGKFLILSEVDAVYRGAELDPVTGKWVAMKNLYGQNVGFPTLQAAYEHWKTKNGKKTQELLNLEKKVLDDYTAASQRRTNVVELNSSHQGETTSGMTPEVAFELVQKEDETEVMELMRQAIRKGQPEPKRVTLYRKGLQVAGLPDIAEEEE